MCASSAHMRTEAGVDVAPPASAVACAVWGVAWSHSRRVIADRSGVVSCDVCHQVHTQDTFEDTVHSSSVLVYALKYDGTIEARVVGPCAPTCYVRSSCSGVGALAPLALPARGAEKTAVTSNDAAISLAQ